MAWVSLTPCAGICGHKGAYRVIDRTRILRGVEELRANLLRALQFLLGYVNDAAGRRDFAERFAFIGRCPFIGSRHP
jgi:hypothetical protein